MGVALVLIREINHPAILVLPLVQGGAPELAKLVQITPISLWFMADIAIVNGVYKPTNITGGAPSCRKASNDNKLLCSAVSSWLKIGRRLMTSLERQHRNNTKTFWAHRKRCARGRSESGPFFRSSRSRNDPLKCQWKVPFSWFILYIYIHIIFHEIWNNMK